MYRLVDTHAHLEQVEDLEQALAEARESNVIAIIAVGTDHSSNQKVLELAEAHKGFVYPALGLHPWELDAATLETTLEFISSHIDRAIALGEVGLDYHKRVIARAGKELQQHAFREVLRIARDRGKPALVHSRYAWRDALTIVEEAGLGKAVFHWYTGTSSVLRDIVSRGYFVSATPAVEYHEEHRRAIKEIPLERLFLETDSPVTYRYGTDGEFTARPAHVAVSLRGTAGLKGLGEAEVAEATTQNALGFFNLPLWKG